MIMGIVQQAKMLEQRSGGAVDAACAVLSHAVRVAQSSAVRSVVLNNLACVEQRRGRPHIAIHHLERAADEEGGLALAPPTTLLNLSAAYNAGGQFVEAAAVAHHAVQRCTAAPASMDADEILRPSLTGVAFYNLGAALLGANELDHASAALHRGLEALDSLPEAGPGADKETAMVRDRLYALVTAVDMKRADREKERAKEEWTASVQPSLIQHAHRFIRSRSALDKTQQRESIAQVLGRGPGSVYLAAVRPARLAELPKRLKLVATASASHVGSTGRPPRLSPIKARTPMPAPSSSPSRHIAPPDWNLSTVTQPARQKSASTHTEALDAEVQRRVLDTFMPRRLQPLADDLRYKEHTRRLALHAEWRRKMRKIEHQMHLQAVVAAEEEARLDIVADEGRVRHVLGRWVHGKLTFVARSGEVEGQEHKSREVISADATQIVQTTLAPQADMVRLMGVEESARRSILDLDEELLGAIELQLESITALILARESLRVSKKGTANALAAWALEATLAQSEAVAFVPAELQKSLAVVERYATFGLPKVLSRKHFAVGGGAGPPEPSPHSD